jgi:serine/threonine protein kinase
MIGQTIDRYRIESKLGEGGMGVVYKARDTHLDRDVAVKILPADKVAEPTRKQRFIREARAASALNHPNIVTLHDVGSRDGLDFMILEYVAGRPLNDVIPSGGMPVASALGYAIQMADALTAAHGAGIFHRDLKPSNVMITTDGRAKILDFGLAKLAEPAGTSPDAPTVAAPLTEEGMVIGTVSYMAPEQAEGRPTDARSDIFSFGIVLYEMTTGRRPFDGRTPLSILHEILHQEPTPPLQINSAIPPDLERVILRCLRKEPARRFQTMADLKAALEDVAAESRSPPRATARTMSRTTSRWMPLLVAVSLAGVAIAGFLAWTRRKPEASPMPLTATALTTFAGVERYPSFAPDGRQIAFSWNGLNGDNEDVWC